MNPSNLADILSKYSSAGAIEKATVKAGAGQLFLVSAFNVNGSTRYLYTFDGEDDSGGNNGPFVLAPIALPTGTGVVIALPIPKKFSALTIALSKGAIGTYTVTTTNDLILTAQFL